MRPRKVKKGSKRMEGLNKRRIFVRGLSRKTTKDTLKEYFAKYGTVVNASIIRDRITNQTLGIGSITFSDDEMVDAVQKVREHTIDGITVRPKRAVQYHVGERDAELTVNKIYVSKMHFKHDEECLREHFGQFGNIVSVNITCKKDRRGYAFIVFDDYDPVDKAVNQRTHRLKNVQLRVVKAYDHNGRERQWTQQNWETQQALAKHNSQSGENNSTWNKQQFTWTNDKFETNNSDQSSFNAEPIQSDFSQFGNFSNQNPGRDQQQNRNSGNNRSAPYTYNKQRRVNNQNAMKRKRNRNGQNKGVSRGNDTNGTNRWF